MQIDATGTGTYRAAAGDLVKFEVTPQAPRVLEVNGQARTFRTAGDVITSDDQGRLTISSPEGTKRIEIDFTDVNDPRRVEVQ
jgi:hypothetical protein